MRFYADMTQSQIAIEIGVSQMHISRLLTRSLTRLHDGILAETGSATTPATRIRRRGAANRPSTPVFPPRG